VVGARQRARQIAGLSALQRPEQTRIATSVSEIARNAFAMQAAARVEFEIERRDGAAAPDRFASATTARHRQPRRGTRRLVPVDDGNGHRPDRIARLMDRWEIHSVPGMGTTSPWASCCPTMVRW
jgi:hypothetical protein